MKSCIQKINRLKGYHKVIQRRGGGGGEREMIVLFLMKLKTNRVHFDNNGGFNSLNSICMRNIGSICPSPSLK